MENVIGLSIALFGLTYWLIKMLDIVERQSEERRRKRKLRKKQEEMFRDIADFNRELDEEEKPVKKQNIICKNPLFAAAWQ